MISTIIEVLDIAASNRLKATARYGLAELQPNGSGGTTPAIYTSSGSWKPITVDDGGDWSYWREIDKVKEDDAPFEACSNLTTRSYTLRLVTLLGRELCGTSSDAGTAAATEMRLSYGTIRTAIKASIVKIKVLGIDTDTAHVFASEFKGIPEGVNTNKALIAIDLLVSITGKDSCFDVCDPIDLTCAIIDKASNDKVEECLGSERIAEICDSDCPDLCELLNESEDPITYSACIPDEFAPAVGNQMLARDTYTADLIVEGIGLAGKTDDVRDLICLDCDDATVQINGYEIGNVAAGDTIDVPVLQNGSPVGSWNGTQWIVPPNNYYWRAITLGT